MSKSNPVRLLETRAILFDARVIGLARAVVRSIGTWRTVHFPTMAGPRSRASLIADHFYQYAAEELADDDGVQFGESHNQKFLVFDERLLIRSKLLDRSLRSSNYPTPTAEAFVEQLELEEFSDFDRLHIGYRLDVAGLNYKDVFITLPQGDPYEFNRWVWQILGSPSETSTIVEQRSFVGLGLPSGREVKYLYEDFEGRLA